MAGLGAIGLSLFALGCPQAGDLDDPQSFPAPPNTGGSGTAGGSGGGGMPSGGGNGVAACETACMTAIVGAAAGCKLCHGKAVHLSGPLDFETPGYAARMKDTPSTHEGLAAGKDKTKDCPMGDKLIDSAAPMNSWLLKKITAMQGTCGDPMPQSGMLSAADQTCMQTFVTCVAMAGGSTPGGGGAPAGGTSSGGAATGGGGAATGGGGAAAGGSGGSGGAKGGTGGTGGV